MKDIVWTLFWGIFLGKKTILACQCQATYQVLRIMSEQNSQVSAFRKLTVERSATLKKQLYMERNQGRL